MGLKDFFKFGKQEPVLLTQETGNSKNFAFSTPFFKIGKGNLSSPHINKYYTENGGYVRFGGDNLYPQLLNQLYYQSAIHSACIDFISLAVMGGGYSWKDEKVNAEQQVNQKTFEKVNKFTKLANSISRDFVIHRRVCILISETANGGKKFKRLDPSTVRNHLTLKKFAYSADWSRGNFEVVEYVRWKPNCKEKESIYVYQEETPGQDVYPIPSYNSILNWAYLDSEQSFFHKANIQNSVFPSAVIRRPKEFGSIEEVEKFKREIGSKQGAENAGRLVVLTGNGKEDLPEFIPVQANKNDSLFTETAKELKDNISIAHKINPAIMGIKVAGSLGNSQEMQMSYTIFEKNVVMPLRDTIEEILNDLVDIANVKNTIVINEFQIIEKEIEEIKE